MIRKLLLATLLVGGLDLLAAFADYYVATGKSPEGVLKYIASGVFGKPAFTGGNQMLLWGVLFHYGIAFLFTGFFFMLYPRVPFMQKNTVVTGIIYGIFIWLVMNVIVIPLSAVPARPFDMPGAVKGAAILIGMMGLPLSLMAKRLSGKISRQKRS